MLKLFSEEEIKGNVPLKLREVLWEITLKCDQNCRFCGSKAVKSDENPDIGKIFDIVDQLMKYPPEVVTITGGEPGCLEPAVLDNVIMVLAGAGIKVRIVTNGWVLQQASQYKYLNNVEIIGLSVNEPWQYDYDFVEGFEKDLTIITNFGVHNIWFFDDIAALIDKNGFGTWQIQLTMGEYALPPNGIAALREKIRKLNEGSLKVNYILSDNLQDEHTCSAGISCCAITADGEVVPCLSERALSDKCTVTSFGNLHNDSLKNIWENEFKSIRFGEGWCNSCRKHIKYPKIKECTPTISRDNVNVPVVPAVTVFDRVLDEVIDDFNRRDPCYPRTIEVRAYDVGGWRNNIMSYGVTTWYIVNGSVGRYSDLAGK